MVWTTDLGIGYHQQDTDYYCGAAVAQMILDSIGAGLLDQNTLYASNHSHNTQSGWSTDPDGLHYTLNDLKPASFDNYFVTYRSDSEIDGSQKIVYTLWHYGVSTGTLVLGCGHWIAVRGVSTDVEPAPGSTYSINGFWVNNPWPYVPLGGTPPPPPPPPHSGSDGCGTGGDRGVANEYAAYTSMWRDTYFTGCDVWGVGHNQYVSVCDPEPPRLGTLRVKHSRQRREEDEFLQPDEAVRLAYRGVEEHGLGRNEAFARALEGASALDPLLVQRLDLPDTFYYLVPLDRGGSVTSLLSVDGLHGEFRGGNVVNRPYGELFLSRESALERSLREPVDFGPELGKVRIRRNAYCLYPLLVWRPCQESRSPYYPFHMLTVGGQRLYIGYDGTIYPTLHPLAPGG